MIISPMANLSLSIVQSLSLEEPEKKFGVIVLYGDPLLMTYWEPPTTGETVTAEEVTAVTVARETAV